MFNPSPAVWASMEGNYWGRAVLVYAESGYLITKDWKQLMEIRGGYDPIAQKKTMDSAYTAKWLAKANWW